MEKRRVVITGLGTVNPLGNTTAESWAAAKAGKCGIGPITQFDASEFKCKLAAEVKNFDPETVVDKKEARKMARFTLLALGAAAEALTDSGLDSGRRGRTHRCQRVQRHRRPAHHRGAAQPWSGKGNGTRSALICVPMAIANMAAAQIAIRFGLKGNVHLPGHGLRGRHQRRGRCLPPHPGRLQPIMVCGGAESLHQPAGHRRFHQHESPLHGRRTRTAASLPFDARRGGFVMGEGSGILVLESLEHAQARGAKIYAEVVGYGANCDAYHFTAPAPGGVGAIGCMKHGAGRRRRCPGAGGPHQRPRHRHPHERQPVRRLPSMRCSASTPRSWRLSLPRA